MGQLDSYVLKNEARLSYLTLYTKINLTWITEIKYKPKIKLPGVYLS